MPPCKRCGQEIGFRNFGNQEAPRWVPWDERLDQAHECPNRDGTPKKKDAAVLGVSPPRQDRVVAPPAPPEETKENLVTRARVTYGETRQVRPYESRRYDIMMEVEIHETDNHTYLDTIRAVLKNKVEGWYLEDLQTDLEGAE